MQVILLSVMVFCSAHVKSTAYKDEGNGVVIFRGEKDRFTRKNSCDESKAVCFNESCTYCQCTEGRTFVRGRGYHGECVSNELLVYATSEYFLLENYPNQFCLAYKHGGRVDLNFVYNMLSCSRENWKQRWMWTKHKQLLNWESLECMTDDYFAKYHYVRMKKCNRTDQKQFWDCEKKNNNELFKQTQSRRYMHHGEYGEYVTTRNISSDVWARFRSGKQVCSQAVGCETFADGSSIIILNKTKCEENLEYLGEKEIELRKTSCSLLPHKFQYLHNDTWKPLAMKNGSFTMATRGKVSLQWNLRKTPKTWRGLLVKVQFKCEDTPGSNNDTEHCVVVKYTGTFEGFYDNDNGGDNDCDSDDDDDAYVKNDAPKYGNGAEIFRGEKDTFTRKISCDATKAVCLNESCTHCQCAEGQTFVRSRGYHGECVSNELLVYATSDGAYFGVQNYPSSTCLHYNNYKRLDYVRKDECYNDWKYHWIWTNYGQLLNLNSLECMTDDYTGLFNKHYVTMRKCDKNNEKQAWICETHINENYIKQKQSGRYMYYGENRNHVTTKSIHWIYSLKLRRFGTSQDVCAQAVGCETFADGSSIILLNKTKCEEKSEYSGEKEIDLNKTSCSLLPHKFQYLYNNTWTALEMKNVSFSIKTMEKVSLQWNLKKTPESWGGLLVKVQFKCEDTPGSIIAATQHCVVIKYTGTFKGFHGSNSDKYCIPHRNKNSINESSDDRGTYDGPDGSQNDENKPTVNQESNGDDEDNPKTIIIIIIVCVLLVLLLTGVAVFIRCRYKNSHGRTRSNKGNNASEDQHQAAVVLPLNESDHEFELSTTNQPTQRDSRAYEVANNHPRNNREESIEPEATGGYVIPQTDIEGSTHDEGYVIERPDTDPQRSQYELPNSHLYESCEYPDQSQSHEYEYPSIMNKKADTAGRTDDDGYSALIRPPLNRNESENGGYTSLIKGQQTSENSGTAGKEDDADDVDPNNSDYTPLVRTPLKDNESESSHYEPLLTNGQITPKKPM